MMIQMVSPKGQSVERPRKTGGDKGCGGMEKVKNVRVGQS
jgi:hypothetical protein